MCAGYEVGFAIEVVAVSRERDRYHICVGQRRVHASLCTTHVRKRGGTSEIWLLGCDRGYACVVINKRKMLRLASLSRVRLRTTTHLVVAKNFAPTRRITNTASHEQALLQSRSAKPQESTKSTKECKGFKNSQPTRRPTGAVIVVVFN